VGEVHELAFHCCLPCWSRSALLLSADRAAAQYNLADLADVVAAIGHHQKRFLEFERNDYRKDCTKNGLESRVVGRVETSG
jgi:hypothetical protein